MYNRLVSNVAERVVILTGMSGAGKSTALRCFEDLGFFCIDNLPPSLIETFLQLFRQAANYTDDIAIVCDVRSGELFRHFRHALQMLTDRGEGFELLYLDSRDRVLVSRFKETRRTPPLGSGMLVEDAVRLERQSLDPVKELATHVVDTSELTPKQLRDRIMGLYAGVEGAPALTVTLISFGFKYGIPTDADFVLDSRFLPNPFYEADLSALTGNDQPVKDFVLGSALAPPFLEAVYSLVGCALPNYKQVHKYNAVIALGCTGGKHRSVCLVNELAERLAKDGYKTTIVHRDIVRA
jgi:RNase adapter protein RapZ